MSVIELHPESLFDVLRAGQLSAAERTRIEAHCARCSACLFELRWLEGSSLSHAPSAQEQAYGEAAFEHVSRKRKAPERVSRGAGWQRILGVGALLVVGGATITWLSMRSGTAELHRPTPVLATTSPQSEPAAQPLPSANVEIAGRDRVAHALSSSARPSANQLLAEARRALSAGRSQRAEGFYRQVIDGHALTSAAAIARVALGRLLYEKQQPSAALVQLDGYLQRRPNGALAEEALFYRALSLKELGESRNAAACLRQLLIRFPRSLYATPARARIAVYDSAQVE